MTAIHRQMQYVDLQAHNGKHICSFFLMVIIFMAANKLAIFAPRLCMRDVKKRKISLPFCKNLNCDRSSHASKTNNIQ
jgi:hypothetical protein